MNAVLEIKSTLSKIKLDSQQLKDKIAFTKQTDVSTGYYLGNLRRLSLQALDVFNAMEKQITYLNNQSRINLIRQNMEIKRRPRRSDDE
jgi:hemerythrin superfamily protein